MVPVGSAGAFTGGTARPMRDIFNHLQRIQTYDPIIVLVEMLLIGLVVWWAVRFLRGTRGARLIKGATLLLAVGYLVIRLLLPVERGWDRLEFLYDRFLFFAFVALVVVFQPELRRALTQIGQARLFRTQASLVEAMISQLVKAADYLSRNKIGALVAIEREVGLGGLVQSGTRVDAKVTAELLNTIFYPGSTLHDMGVVIQNGRVSAAGVQFPLAESDEVDRSLGSRHRAALGLSQESDAVVLVVSEETGRVSLAFDGQLSVGVDPDRLRETLVGLLTPSAMLNWSRKGGASAVVGDGTHWWTRLDWHRLLPGLRTLAWVALITGLIWLWADLEHTGTLPAAATVNVTPPPGSRLRIVEPGPEGETIHLELAGSQASLEELSRQINSGEPLVFDLQPELDWPLGRREVDLAEVLNRWPRLRDLGLTVRSVKPATLSLELDRWVPVEADVRLAHDEDVQLDTPTISPESVTVLVPESRLGEIGQNPTLPTQWLNLDGVPRDQEVTRTVPLESAISGVPVMLRDARNVSVTFRINQRLVPGTIPRKAAEGIFPTDWVLKGVPGGYQLETRREDEWRKDIQLVGPPTEIERILANPELVKAQVRFGPNDIGRDESWLDREVQILTPPGVKVVSPVPWKVEFRFRPPTTPTTPATP